MKICAYTFNECVFKKGIRCNYKDECDMQTEIDIAFHKPKRVVLQREVRE